MLDAYVLIQAEPGRAGPARVIREIDGVRWADDLAGPYDVIARIQASTLDELGRLVVRRIHAVDGVTRTLICTVLHR